MQENMHTGDAHLSTNNVLFIEQCEFFISFAILLDEPVKGTVHCTAMKRKAWREVLFLLKVTALRRRVLSCSPILS
jgi:hypothetical protein